MSARTARRDLRKAGRSGFRRALSRRLQSLAPTQSPYSMRGRLGTRPSRCSHDLFPLRGIPVSTVGPKPSPHVLARPKPEPPEDGNDRGFAALQGIDPVEPGCHSEEWRQPPWSLQPRPISGDSPHSKANPREPPEARHASAADFGEPSNVTRCEESVSAEANPCSSYRAT
jgi:hypothetical protein